MVVVAARPLRLSLRTAQSYMRLANNSSAIEAANASRDSYLPIREAVALLAAPAKPIEQAETLGEIPDEIPARVVAFVLLAKRLRRIDPRIELSPIGLVLPPDITFEKWVAVGQILARELPEATE
jgi:hypothetical protein